MRGAGPWHLFSTCASRASGRAGAGGDHGPGTPASRPSFFDGTTTAYAGQPRGVVRIVDGQYEMAEQVAADHGSESDITPVFGKMS